MAFVLQLLFWLSVLCVLYTYVGYPLLLKAISLIHSKSVHKAIIFPPVSFIITAHNEESSIKSKIENTLSIDYPKEKLQVIVASDASDDDTDRYVREYADHGVELVRTPDRKGKENAQKHALDKARGEIVVFSDVATILKPDALKHIVSNFSDSSVGCVSSVDRFIDTDGNLSGEGAYVRYEMLLRRLESRVNTLVGLSGSFFAARKAVCQNWRIDLQSDFNTLLNSIKLHLRGVSDQHSIGYYKNLDNPQKERDRKLRTVLRGITVFMDNLSLLNPFSYGLFSWQLASHKLCRWLVPLFLLITLLSNALLIPYSYFYLITFFMQVCFYALGIFCRDCRISWLTLPYYFLSVNGAILLAWLQYFRGIRFTYWSPSER